MRNLPAKLEAFRRLPRSVARKVTGRVRVTVEQFRDTRSITFSSPGSVCLTPLRRWFHRMEAKEAELREEVVRATTALFANHYFDVLGSGWVKVDRCTGIGPSDGDPGLVGEGESGRVGVTGPNLLECQRILRLLPKSYKLIDWQRDFKSGHRWSERVWHRDIRWGERRGADIKVPWELARMQHLVQFAWAYALAVDGRPGFRPATDYADEFRNQVLDFIATNPPRFGVNWHCTMDVAIRAANWLIAYDLFRAQGAALDPEFQAVFSRSIYEHGRHIVNNLEWQPEFRNNHYLADVVGLLFVGAYLPRSPRTDAWVAFAVQELVTEVGHQFHMDGTNFEGSTCYHCFSAEMVAYGVALVLALANANQLPKDYDPAIVEVGPRLRPGPSPTFATGEAGRLTPFPAWFVDRLHRMGQFASDIAGASGRTPQIGDNDSGRFFKLFPSYQRLTVGEAKGRFRNLDGYCSLQDEEPYWWEDTLDHRSLTGVIAAIFDQKPAGSPGASALLEWEMWRILTGTGVHLAPGANIDTTGSGRLKAKWDAESPRDAMSVKQVYSIGLTGAEQWLGNLRLICYPDSGLYIWKAPQLLAMIRCGSIGQKGVGGHDHFDQLGLYLEIDGSVWVGDPGTFCYSSFPELRDQYRSAACHWVPKPVMVQVPLEQRLFQLNGAFPGCPVHVSVTLFEGCHTVGTTRIHRRIEFGPGSVIIKDLSNVPLARLPEPGSVLAAGSLLGFSPGYGWRCRQSGES